VAFPDGVAPDVARRKRKACGNVWPINEAAGRQPAGWPGWPDGKRFAFVLTTTWKARRLGEMPSIDGTLRRNWASAPRLISFLKAAMPIPVNSVRIDAKWF